MRRVVTILLGISVAWWLMRQCRKPTGWMGRRVLRVMNLSHSGLTDWGLQDFSIGRHDTIQEASVSHLPFADGMCDLVTAVETHYYWPDVVGGLREIRRVLKPGGRLVVIGEAYSGGRLGPLPRMVMKPMGGTVPSIAELRDQFSSAGYTAIEAREESRRGWMRVTGRRPVEGPATSSP